MANETPTESTLLVGQSGGATAVINASLAGVVDAAWRSGEFERVLGLRNGIEGLFQERFVDLTRQDQDLINRIGRTPSAALGTGRYKLRDEDLDRAVIAMRRLGVTAFVYIGGNDSADTAHRLEAHAHTIGYELRVMSVPKTIDNDLPETDHCPGYPSIARYLGNAVRDATYDTLASPQLYPVKFVEVMGRDAGWVAAAGALGFSGAEIDLAPLVLLPERAPQSVDDVLAAIDADVRRRGFSIVVVPETMHTSSGRHFGGDEPEYVDGFGHPYFPSTGAAMTRLVSQKLQLRARYDKPGTAARMSIALASEVDLDEAYRLGAGAVDRMVDGASGFMTAISRTSDDPYTYDIIAVPLEKIANQVRHLDDAFIGADGMSVTPAFHAYMRPLLGKEPFPPYGRFG
ncbi:MAG TPA: diphosphate--fructose-6-phosphate 1-phosphotransferase [Thermomicrobiales bacterium]|nr:diphosphate--fructose-6-phosphate 1-phosphotransferase [Thermomicrobiales bacterium]